MATAFLSAGAMFGGAALYGYTTKRSLARIGGFASMAVFGLIVAIIVNVFLGSGPIGFIISIVGVVVFTVLTAFDVQRIATGELVGDGRLGGEGGRDRRAQSLPRLHQPVPVPAAAVRRPPLILARAAPAASRRGLATPLLEAAGDEPPIRIGSAGWAQA